MLFAKTGPKENLVVRGARVLDPVAGVDAVLDVRVDNGVVAALGTDLDTNSHRVIEADAGPRETVQVRGLRHRVAIHTQRMRTVLVRH